MLRNFKIYFFIIFYYFYQKEKIDINKKVYILKSKPNCLKRQSCQMKNQLIAEIFYEMADILEMQEVQWKPRAYRRAARAIESLPEDIEDIYKLGGIKELEEIPGVGERIAKKIEEYLKTGKIKEYLKLKKSVPKHIDILMRVPGMGPKKAKMLFQELGISTIKQLEAAAKKHKIAELPRMGLKSEEDIIRGIEILKQGAERTLLGYALPIAKEIVTELKKLKEVDRIETAGSLRRMQETIRDIDILVASKKPPEVMEFFTKLKQVKTILAKGHTKSTVILNNGMQADVRVVPLESFGAALQYFTGSKEHNIALRQIAIKKGLKLSEYGVFNRKTNKAAAGKTEQDVYKILGLTYIEPELRENRGEIEAARQNKLPRLIGYKAIKGDFHVHSKWSDGENKIIDIAKAAKKLGYQYICISDHSKSQKIASGLSEKGILKKLKEIAQINKQIKGIRVLSGAEVDIKGDGSLDYTDSLLKRIDIVTAAVHSGFKQPKSEMTKRILKGLENKYVDIFAHPTGRIINERPGYNVDLDQVFELAKDRKVHMEINAFPDRLDLNDQGIKAAIEAGLKLAIGTDSHNIDQLRYIQLGVAQARRGWATNKDIINTSTLAQLKKYFKRL
jgi:DNA polymerase (family 10)